MNHLYAKNVCIVCKTFLVHSKTDEFQQNRYRTKVINK